jgi:hypothetical protein
MSKTYLGIICILAGLMYGSLSIDVVYNSTMGYLIEHKWISPPVVEKTNPNLLGKKVSILLYSLLLIALGIYLVWNHQI